TPAWSYKGRLLARLHQDGQSLMLKVGFDAREHLVRADPETFFVTEHYRNYPSVLARLDRLSAADLRKLLARAVGRGSPSTLMLLSFTTLVQRSVSNFSFSR